MFREAFIISRSQTVSRSLMTACGENEISTHLMHEKSAILRDIEKYRPGLVFIQALYLEESKDIIHRMKLLPHLLNTKVVVVSGRHNFKKKAISWGADGFLDIPVMRDQFIPLLKDIYAEAKEGALIS